MRSLATVIFVTFTVLAAFPGAVAAHGGGHGFGHGDAQRHGAHFAGGRRHGDDAYIRAAIEDRDKLLATKIKSICRGC
jgi:hypothetical protein